MIGKSKKQQLVCLYPAGGSRKSNDKGAASGAPTNRIAPVGALLAAPSFGFIKKLI